MDWIALTISLTLLIFGIVFVSMIGNHLFVFLIIATVVLALGIVLNMIFGQKTLYVKQHSKACQQAEQLNEKYKFSNIQRYEYSCEYFIYDRKINAKDEAIKKLNANYDDVLKSYREALNNAMLWSEYTEEYDKAKVFLTQSEIRNLPKRKMSIKKFAILENQIFASRKLPPPPTTKIALSFTVVCKTPKGEILHTSRHILSHDDIEAFIKIKN